MASKQRKTAAWNSKHGSACTISTMPKKPFRTVYLWDEKVWGIFTASKKPFRTVYLWDEKVWGISTASKKPFRTVYLWDEKVWGIFTASKKPFCTVYLWGQKVFRNIQCPGSLSVWCTCETKRLVNIHSFCRVTYLPPFTTTNYPSNVAA